VTNRGPAARALGKLAAHLGEHLHTAIDALAKTVLREQSDFCVNNPDFSYQQAISALSKFGADAAMAVPELMAGLQDEAKSLAALYALSKLPDVAAPALPLVLVMLSQQRLPLNSNTEIRCIYMATIIGNAGRKYQLSQSAEAPAVADLCRLLTVKGYPRVREAAALALQKLRHWEVGDAALPALEAALPALERASKDSAHEVRTVARNIVQRIERLQFARNTLGAAQVGG